MAVVSPQSQLTPGVTVRKSHECRILFPICIIHPYPHNMASEISDMHGSARTGGDAARLSEVKFLTVAEVAQVMRVSKMTVYRLVHSGELPAVRVGRSFRVPEQAVQEYLRDAYVADGM